MGRDTIMGKRNMAEGKGKGREDLVRSYLPWFSGRSSWVSIADCLQAAS